MTTFTKGELILISETGIVRPGDAKDLARFALALLDTLEQANAETDKANSLVDEFRDERNLLQNMAGKRQIELEAAEKRIAEFDQRIRTQNRHACELFDEAKAQRQRVAELEARNLTLPPLNDDLLAILGRPNFTCSHLAELMRKSGDEIRRKSEHEQAAVIHWFLGLYLEHGENWEVVAKADIQSRVAVATAGIKGE